MRDGELSGLSRSRRVRCVLVPQPQWLLLQGQGHRLRFRNGVHPAECGMTRVRTRQVVARAAARRQERQRVGVRIGVEELGCAGLVLAVGTAGHGMTL